MDPDAQQLRLAMAQLPARMRRATQMFRALTGLSAVTSLRRSVDDRGGLSEISPPVHPCCASRLRTTKIDAPCEEQWRWHMRTGARTRAVHRHRCPLGMRCACLPIFYGDTLVGIAKVVAGPETTDRRFSLVVQALDLAMSKVCQDFHIASLTEKLDGLQRRVANLQKVPQKVRSAPRRAGPASEAQAGSLVDQTLRYIADHHLDQGLSLAGVSRELGVNDKYLTGLFTRVVGQRMHAYILGLRVQHACRLLLSTDRQIKTIAYESGFRAPERFRRAFREHLGIAPAAYRRIFSPP